VPAEPEMGSAARDRALLGRRPVDTDVVHVLLRVPVPRDAPGNREVVVDPLGVRHPRDPVQRVVEEVEKRVSQADRPDIGVEARQVPNPQLLGVNPGAPVPRLDADEQTRPLKSPYRDLLPGNLADRQTHIQVGTDPRRALEVPSRTGDGSCELSELELGPPDNPRLLLLKCHLEKMAPAVLEVDDPGYARADRILTGGHRGTGQLVAAGVRRRSRRLCLRRERRETEDKQDGCDECLSLHVGPFGILEATCPSAHNNSTKHPFCQYISSPHLHTIKPLISLN